MPFLFTESLQIQGWKAAKNHMLMQKTATPRTPHRWHFSVGIDLCKLFHVFQTAISALQVCPNPDHTCASRVTRLVLTGSRGGTYRGLPFILLWTYSLHAHSLSAYWITHTPAADHKHDSMTPLTFQKVYVICTSRDSNENMTFSSLISKLTSQC